MLTNAISVNDIRNITVGHNLTKNNERNAKHLLQKLKDEVPGGLCIQNQGPSGAMEAGATQKSLAEASLITKVNNKSNKLNRVNDISKDIKIKFDEVEKVKVGYTNVRSLVRGTKREELEMLMQEQDIGILGLTETWGRSDIMDGEFDFPGFKLYRKDRSAVNDKKRWRSCTLCQRQFVVRGI